MEKNMLLAEFIDLELNEEKTHYVDNTIYEEVEIQYLDFSNSWDMVMQIVDKIESLGFDFNITTKHVTVSKDNHSVIYQTFVYSVDGTDKLKATYITAFEFVLWYNQQNK